MITTLPPFQASIQGAVSTEETGDRGVLGLSTSNRGFVIQVRVSEEFVSPSLEIVPLRMYYFGGPFRRGTFPGVLSSQTGIRKSIVCYLKRVLSHLFRSSTNFSLTYCLYRVWY